MRRLLVWLAVGVGLSVPAVARAEEPLDGARVAAAVDKVASKAMAGPGAAGLSVCVRLDGHVVLSKGYGVADIEDGRAVTPRTMFHACSVSKQFAAAAIMRLVEQGKVKLDDPITRFVPELPTPGGTVTLRHLLTHTSGLKGYTEVERFEKLEGRDLTHDEVLAVVRDEPPLFAPGERFVYCNTGPYLLGMAVERVSGKEYGRYLGDEFFGPLGLHRSCYDPGLRDADLAVPHDVKDGKAAHAKAIAWSDAFASGGVLSTSEDLAAWMEALSSGRVVSPASFAEMTTGQKLNSGVALDYGFCLFVRAHHGHRVFFHTGSGPGCSAWLADYPDDHLIIAVMSNSAAVGAPRLGMSMAMAAFGIDTTPRDLPVGEPERARYSGRFRLEQWEDEGKKDGVARIYAQDTHLWIDAGVGRVSRLLNQGAGVFVVEAAPHVTVSFEGASGSNAEPASSCICDDGTHAQTGRRLPD